MSNPLFYPVPERFAEPYRAYIKALTAQRLKAAYLFGIVLVPSAFIFDLIIFPTRWRMLLGVRLVSMVLCLLLLFLSQGTRLRESPLMMSHVLNVVIASTIVYLTALTGAYRSPYYAGLNLIFICMGMIAPWGVRDTLTAGVITISLHLVFNVLPSVLRKDPIDWPILWNSIYFLTFTFAMVVISSGVMENSRRKIYVATEQEKIRSKELEDSTKKIDELMKTKNLFLANITHELKTPLSIVIGNADLILEQAVQSAGPLWNQAALIQQAAFQLATHVDRIIAVSTLDDPEVRLNLANYDYLGIVQNVFHLFEEKAKDENITFTLTLPPPPVVLNVDIIRVEEVLSNLIQNAFKFTDAGGSIAVRVRVDGDQMVTDVSDTGIGIPEDRTHKIFERLYQADEVLSKRHGGIGLGLYICKKNVELHGGTISISSTVGQGTTFQVKLPLYLDQGATVKNAPYDGEERRSTEPRRRGVDRRMEERRRRFEYQQNVGLDDLARMAWGENLMDQENRLPAYPSVLIVEDNTGMMKVIVEALRDEYNLFLAQDGFEALEKLRRNEGRISLVLSDVMMPGLSGFDLCAKVMEREEWRHIPLIFITALLSQEDHLKGYELGATDYIVKPYNLKILKEKVAHWISRRQYEILLRDVAATLEMRAQDMSRMKDIILHEIRNPIQVIDGARFFLEKVRLGSEDHTVLQEAQWRKSVRMLHQGTEALKGVLGAVQELCYGGLSSRSPQPLSALFSDAVAMSAHLVKGIALEVDIGRAADRCVLCDNRMLTQVFVNLIRNATDAIRERNPTEGGMIRIACECPDEKEVIIRVQDNGTGISPEVMERLFQFKYTTKKDGTGIGLHLSKMILKLHEGSISVDSDAGKGTTFLVSLPLHASEPKALSASA